MRLYNIGFVAIAIASPSVSSNWVKLGGSDARTVYVDASSVVPVSSWRGAWTKYEYVGGSLKEYKSLDYYDCTHTQTALKSGVAYKRDGSSESSTWQDYELRWEPVVPDT